VVKSGAFRIAGGAARNQATRGWHVAVQPGLSGATQSAAATFTAGSGGGRVGLVVRYRNSSNYLTCYRQVGANSAVRIANVVNGVETVLKSVAVPNPTAPFSLSCKATGSTVTLALNRTPRASASGLPLASGTVGLMLGGVNPAVAPPAHKADAFTATVK
jgi:hypothetical protein